VFSLMGLNFLMLGLSLLMSSYKKGSCVTSEMNMAAVDQLKKFNMVQQYPVYLKRNKKADAEGTFKQVLTLNRGVRYKFFAIKNPDYTGQPVLTIYNNEKMEFMIGSTYNASFKRFYNELEFECKTSGNYCFTLNFLDGEEGCALGVYSSLIQAK